MPKWMLLLLSSVARAPDGAEGGAPTAPDANPQPTAEAPAEPEGNGSLIPDAPADKPAEGAKPPTAEGDAKADDVTATADEPIDISKLKLPEGMKADDPALAKLVETLGDPKLSPAERTEALLSQYGDVAKGIATQAQKAVADNYASINAAWVKEIREDPTLGRDKFDQTISSVAKAIDTWSPDPKAMREALSLTGAGNNPAVIRTLHAMAVALAEGKPAPGSVSPGSKSAAEVFYGNTSQQ